MASVSRQCGLCQRNKLSNVALGGGSRMGAFRINGVRSRAGHSAYPTKNRHGVGHACFGLLDRFKIGCGMLAYWADIIWGERVAFINVTADLATEALRLF